ncbi:MAG: PAS domain-containing protein, partial [Mesotoga sp.]
MNIDGYRDFLSLLRNGIILCELTFEGRCKVIDANPAALETEGLTREAAIGMDLEHVFPPAREFSVMDGVRRVNETGIPLHIGSKHNPETRSEVWRDVSISRLSSNVIAIVYNDFDESSEARKDLKKSKLELDRLFSNLPGIAFRCKNDKDWTMEVL